VGSNEQDLMGLAPELDRRFFVVSVRAPITLQAGAYAWFHVQFTPNGFLIEPSEAEESRQALLKFVDEAVEEYGLDPNRVYLMGFSQGCIISLSAALTMPKKFAGVVAMSGRILPDIVAKIAGRDETKGLPVLLLHGTEDTVIPISHGRNSREILEDKMVDLEYHEYRMGHYVSPESMFDIKEWLRSRLDQGSDWRRVSV
ncbi:MAG: alpha/beta hydrolase, partial [Bryobacteraceae bacterium]